MRDELLGYYERELIFLRRSVWPLREVISWMLRDDTPLIKE